MLKKIIWMSVGILMACNVQAFDKKQINPEQDIWGTWTIHNEKLNCSEVYQFSKPGQLTYTSNEKRITGDFAIWRSMLNQDLDLLSVQVKSDNKAASCGGPAIDMTNGKLQLNLKWISATSAELCSDHEAKLCSGLYLIKQK